MTLSRRNFLGIAIAGAAVAGETFGAIRTNPTAAALIDRKSLVTRHNPIVTKLDPLSPLSIGNGEFAFTAGVTGLQTFTSEYENSMPLCTMSQWGWHTTPLPAGLDPKDLRLTQYDTHGRSVGYHTSSDGQAELFNWLRQNPHRLNLGQVGLYLLQGGAPASISDVSEINQKLDLWSGILESKFKFDGAPIATSRYMSSSRSIVAISGHRRRCRVNASINTKRGLVSAKRNSRPRNFT